MTDFWAMPRISVERCSESKQGEETDTLIGSLGKQTEGGVNNTRTCKQQARWAPPSTLNRRRGASSLDLGRWEGACVRGDDGGDEEVWDRSAVYAHGLTNDEMMLRLPAVLQTEDERVFDLPLSETHARTRIQTHRHTLTMNEERWTSNLVPCYRMSVLNKGCCYTRTVHTNSTLLSLLVVLHAYNTESFKTSAHQDRCAAEQVRYWCTNSNLCHLHSNYSTFFLLLLSSIYLHEVYNASSSLI